MLYPEYVSDFARYFKDMGKTVYLYTAMYHPQIREILPVVDGVQYTLHAPLSRVDLDGFQKFQDDIRLVRGSYRLYIDPSITTPIVICPNLWRRVEVKPWILEGACPLPPGETLFILDGSVP